MFRGGSFQPPHFFNESEKKMKASLGKVVSIQYSGGIKGEAIVDEVMGDDFLTVMIGDMKLPRGIEQALEGMEQGDRKTVEIPPDLGYGPY